MGEAAVALARHAGYVNAGTVELIAERDDPSRFFFLEVNTRLQVEHPVTEAVTGLDLVELQLRVAAGEPLPLTQAEVRRDGWAVEARIYAEDPAAGFLPSSGAVVAYREPAGVRVDSGIEEGTVVGTDYDPMLAKVVAAGSDREEALARLRRALGELVVAGPTTNAAYLRALLARPEVRAGEIDTGLIERLGDEVASPPRPPSWRPLALVAMLGEPEDDDIWSDPHRLADAGPGLDPPHPRAAPTRPESTSRSAPTRRRDLGVAGRRRSGILPSTPPVSMGRELETWRSFRPVDPAV